MKLLPRLSLPALAAAFLLLGAAEARADMCFGGPRPPPIYAPDAGAPANDGGLSWNSPATKQLGTGLLAAAVLSTGWVCFRRKGKDEG
ncbi:MAG: hypothetical protein QM765_32790 [Myxococcales bacterium]